MTKIGAGKWKQGTVWKGQTNLSSIEVGGQTLQKIVLPDDLKDLMHEGDDVELLVLPFNLFEKTICGIRVNGKTSKCGASYQLAVGLITGILFGWLLLPLVVAVISMKCYLEIDAF
ncbi:MAG: hypothetical protein GC139_09475 [Sideroxydans sp.]|nr:hypothetical protein [Sideroxydans sp.]